MIEVEQLARVMFKARCDKIGCTELQATHLSGDDHGQYMDIAETVADFVNQYDVEARAVAKYLLERVNPTQIEAISRIEYSPPNRVLP
jgi:hypothetical protein